MHLSALDAQACTVCGASQREKASPMLHCLSCQRLTHEQCDSTYIHKKMKNGKVKGEGAACNACWQV